MHDNSKPVPTRGFQKHEGLRVIMAKRRAKQPVSWRPKVFGDTYFRLLTITISTNLLSVCRERRGQRYCDEI